MTSTVKTSPVVEWYKGRSIFVTGATGFMGKVLLEKLLSSCYHLEKIYVLIRAKRDQSPNERLAQIFEIELFDQLRKTNPNVFQKVVVCEGDITLPNLGLSASDRRTLTENVSVVFHSAATVKFDEKLKISVNMNILGTQKLMKLCQEMNDLQAFVHVSTAYCNCNRSEIEEMIYEPPTDLNKLIQCIDCLDDEILHDITPKLIGDRPNTYTFTKAAAESALSYQHGKLPVAIVRPSIVTAAWHRPLPGWVDNLNGPTGLFVGAGKGALRSILCHRQLVADFIPVDVAIDLIVCVAWRTAIERSEHITVYNCTSGEINPITWGEMERLGQKCLLENPVSGALWYPGGSFKSNRMINTMCCLMFHALPAYLVDLFRLVTGKKPKMVKIYKKLSKAVESLEYFATREWKFKSKNVPKLWSELTEDDKQIFHFDVSSLEWTKYVENYYMGTKLYVLNETPEEQHHAKKHLQRMKYIHISTQVVVFAVIWRLLFHGTTIADILYQCIFSVFVYLIGFISDMYS